MGRKLPSLFGTRKYRLKKPSSRSDWGTSSIAPLRRREDGSCCSTEAFEVLLTTVWWTPSKRGGLWPNWIVYSRTELCGEPKMIPLVDAPIRERNAIEEAECCILDVIPVLGCQKGPGGGGDFVHHEGRSLASLFMDWRAVGEYRTCLLSRGPQLTEEQVVVGERLMSLPTATLRYIEDGGLLHTKICWVGVANLSVESELEPGRNV